ncbi:MAG: mannose-6-phosphate isomerase, class I [Spirochaetota bacterium]
MIYRLLNTIQHYAWGSPTALGELYGYDNPGGDPMAELRMGAHPKAPSMIEKGGERTSLRDHIAQDPERALGPRAGEHGGVLPFLFKILSAAAPLSIQVHPTIDQAREGYSREEHAGIDRSAPNRNYRDENHKPELICAIRPFWGLRGFRTVREITEEFTAVELSEADVSLELPESEDDLRRFFRSLLELPEDERRELIAGAVSLSRGRWHGHGDALPEEGDPLARYYWVLRIADQYPGDVGILSPLILNVFSLRPGEATYQPAGVLHAYLHGVGAELMANSDNVLRGGMTVKHVDVDELLKVGRFRSEEPIVLAGEPCRGDESAESGCATIRYATPFSEFEFSRIVPGSECELLVGVAQILFCHEGPVRIIADGAELALHAGESVFVDAATGMLRAHGSGELFAARVPG